jgi:hypothetical protein
VRCSEPLPGLGSETRHAMRSLSCLGICGFSLCESTSLMASVEVLVWFLHRPQFGGWLLIVAGISHALGRSILHCAARRTEASDRTRSERSDLSASPGGSRSDSNGHVRRSVLSALGGNGHTNGHTGNADGESSRSLV